MIPPVTQSFHVPALAFHLFVRQLPEWWPIATRSGWLDKSLGCHVDARVGGRIVENGPDGAEEHWGTFRRFNEASDVLIEWHPGLPADYATEVEVQFRSCATGTMA